MVLTPSGQRVSLDGEGPDVVELGEQGFYEVRVQGPNAPPVVTVASNVDLAESDLSPMDPQDVVAGATGRAGGAVPPGANVPTPIRTRRRTSGCGGTCCSPGWFFSRLKRLSATAYRSPPTCRRSGRQYWGDTDFARPAGC